jgi:hypothetical protein
LTRSAIAEEWWHSLPASREAMFGAARVDAGRELR